MANHLLCGLTVAHVAGASSAVEQAIRAREWAGAAWSAHHDQVWAWARRAKVS